MFFPGKIARPTRFFILSAVSILLIFPTSLFAVNTPWLHVDNAWLEDPDGINVVLRGIAVLPPKDRLARGGFEFIAEKATELDMYSLRVVPASSIIPCGVRRSDVFLLIYRSAVFNRKKGI